jgi:predicted nucleic acid-binding protein
VGSAVCVNGDGRVFIDSNILVYAYDVDAGDRHHVARNILQDLWNRGTGLLSAQVLQEFYNVAKRKFVPRMSGADIRNVIAVYSPWCVLPTDPLVVFNAALLAETHTVSWWDALIIESACQSGAKYLLSEDLRDGRQFAGLEIRNPFREVAA